jgi:hypothetical protein
LLAGAAITPAWALLAGAAATGASAAFAVVGAV